MKAISLWQPWASAIPVGLKAVETRHWTTSHRGLLAIHAAKRWQRDERELAAAFARQFDAPLLADPPLGAVVAIVNLIDVRRSEELLPHVSETEQMFGNYGPRRFGWRLNDVRALPEPVPCRGAQGFFDLPAEVAEVVAKTASSLPKASRSHDLFSLTND